MAGTWFDDAADWTGQACEGLADAAGTMIDTAVFAVGMAILVCLVMHLGPIFLVWFAGAPAWVVMMLIFGL